MNSTDETYRHAIEKFDWLEPFEARRWWQGGWLQTVSVKTLRPELSVETWSGSVAFNVPDDSTPPDTLTGFYLPLNSDGGSEQKPAVIVLYGMGGHAQSGYILSLAIPPSMSLTTFGLPPR